MPGSPFIVQIAENEDSFGSLISETALKNVSLNKGIDFRVENRNDQVDQCRVIITCRNIFKTLYKHLY